MKEIFDWLREQIEEAKYLIVPKGASSTYSGAETVVDMADVENLITEAEAKWKEKEAELRANVIDEFAERMKIIFGEGIIPDEEKMKYEKNAKEMICGQNVTFKVAIKLVDEIASQMKGEKE